MSADDDDSTAFSNSLQQDLFNLITDALIQNRQYLFCSDDDLFAIDTEENQQIIEVVINKIIQEKEGILLIISNFQMNQPCGLEIVDLILTLSNDQHDFKDLLNLISKLSLRYMY